MAGKIRVRGGKLELEMQGFDRLFSIKKSMTLPLEHIESVSTERAHWLKPLAQLRMGGTALPGVIKDGRYLTSKGWAFYVMHDPSRCITLNLKHERYRCIVFEVDDKNKAAARVNRAIKTSRR